MDLCSALGGGGVGSSGDHMPSCIEGEIDTVARLDGGRTLAVTLSPEATALFRRETPAEAGREEGTRAVLEPLCRLYGLLERDTVAETGRGVDLLLLFLLCGLAFTALFVSSGVVDSLWSSLSCAAPGGIPAWAAGWTPFWISTRILALALAACRPATLHGSTLDCLSAVFECTTWSFPKNCWTHAKSVRGSGALVAVRRKLSHIRVVHLLLFGSATMTGNRQ